MKKLKIAAVVALAVLVECAGIAFAVKHFPWRKNERILLSLMHEFKGVVSEHADIVEDQSVYGKLIGNGNGIQYFGCVLILKDSLKDEKALMEELGERFESVGCRRQEGQEISEKYLEHRRLQYDTPIDDGQTYLTVYFFNSRHPDSHEWDVAGH